MSAFVSGGTEYIVAVPTKRNYLSHLAVNEGDPLWATRAVKALCGWTGFAKGTTRDADSHRDADGLSVRRRRCAKCETIQLRAVSP